MRGLEPLNREFFNTLCFEALAVPSDRERLEGVMQALHEVPFYWTTFVSDANRAGDALTYRQYEFRPAWNYGEIKREDLTMWLEAAPSVLEVLLGIARRYSAFFEWPASHYFQIMLMNMNLHHYSGVVLNNGSLAQIRDILDTWMSRQFKPDGTGSPFPVPGAKGIGDMRRLDIWSQMNAYSAVHFG